MTHFNRDLKNGKRNHYSPIQRVSRSIALENISRKLFLVANLLCKNEQHPMIIEETRVQWIFVLLL